MTERKISTETYWQGFDITDQDIEDLTFLFLEVERPMVVSELAQALIANHCRREENLMRRQLSRGTVYRPNGSFSVGERLVFPHLDFALGTVVDRREGHNPEYGEFKVITVQFEGNGSERGPHGGVAHADMAHADVGHRCETVPEGEIRSFAAEFQVPHKLAFPQETSWETHFSVSAEDLYTRYGELVTAKLAQRLEAEPDFVSFRGKWLPVSMWVDLHLGYLNIAEAVIDVRGEPLSPEALVVELELPEEIPESIRMFSLNRALYQDDRFDDVGDHQRVIWSLRRWEPPGVLSCPARLQYEPVAYDRTGLDVAHLQLEREIDDDASQLIAPPTAASANSVTILLGHPHWRTGTLPLTERTRVFFPGGSPDQHTQINFRDRTSGNNPFPGWVVRSHRYVYGLKKWYESNGIVPGALIRLERTKDTHSVAIDVIPRRMQREWVRVAFSVDGELVFQMQKRPIAYEYDELCVLDEEDPEAIDGLWRREQERGRPLDELVRHVFLELVKLSPNGMVHSKTLYSAVNILRRCPPGLVFATLFRFPEFVTAGDGYWIFQGSTNLR